MYEHQEHFSSLSGVDVQDETRGAKGMSHCIVWDIVHFLPSCTRNLTEKLAPLTPATPKRIKIHRIKIHIIPPFSLIFTMRRKAHILEFSSKVVTTALMSLSSTKAPRSLSSMEICTNKVVQSHFKLDNGL